MKVNQSSTIAIFHEQENLVASAFQLRRVGVNVGDDVPMALQFLHGLHLDPHTGQGIFVRDSHTFEYRSVISLDWLGEPHEIDKGKASL